MLYLFFVALLAATFLSHILLAREEEPDILWRLIPLPPGEDTDRSAQKGTEAAFLCAEEDRMEGYPLRMIAPEVARMFITSPLLLDLFDEYLVFVQQRPERSLEHFRCHRANEQLLAQIRQEEAEYL